MIHHIELYVSDLASAEGFWGWLLGELGYELYQQFDQGRSYRFGDHYLVIVQVEERHAHRSYHRCGPGLNHLSFHGHSRQHVVAPK